MAKGKGSKSSGGPRKPHGPKKHLFKEYKPLIRAFANAGLLDKYHNYDSWSMACSTRNKKNVTRSEFNEFRSLSKEEQEKFFNKNK